MININNNKYEQQRKLAIPIKTGYSNHHEMNMDGNIMTSGNIGSKMRGFPVCFGVM
jgi:hypothetical protein